MGMPGLNPIYSAFIEDPRVLLNDEDRAALRRDRGFTDETIDRAMLKSTDPRNAEVVESMRANFQTEELLASGLLVWRGGLTVPNSQLLDKGRVLIPYYNSDEQCYHLRPHKLGFKDVAIQPYFAGLAADCVLTESEFKALASYQYSVPAIGIPGISSFIKEHYQRLYDMLLALNIKNLTIIFDNEIKDDPALPNFKADEAKRWDTPLYAILMARRIARSAKDAESPPIKVRIGTLPDAWRVNGKVDIDGALAQGRTPEEYREVLDRAITAAEYLKSLPAAAQGIVTKRIRAFELGLTTRRSFGKYEILTDLKDGGTYWRTVSNFTIEIKAMVQTNDGHTKREAIIESPFQPEPEVVMLSANDILKPENFQHFLYDNGIGKCEFTGDKEDLRKVISLEHARVNDNLVLMPDHVGKIDGEDVRLFGNGMVANGEIIKPSYEEVCWYNGRGWKAAKYADTKSKISSRWRDQMPMPDFDNWQKIDLLEISTHLYDNFGQENGGYEAVLGFAWFLSCAYSNAFYEEYGSFPLLYLMGEPQSGKSTFARWGRRMYGVSSPGQNIEGSTLVGLDRNLSYYSDVPAHFDECKARALTKTAKETMLRSIYDRQPNVKGMRSGNNEMRISVFRAPVVISGEELPTDKALATRCITLHFVQNRNGKTKPWGCEYEWLRQQSETTFPAVLPHILMKGPAEKNLLDETRKAYDIIKKDTNGDARVALNYAIPLAIYDALVKPNDTDFRNYLVTKYRNYHAIKAEERPWQTFLEDLHVLERDGKIKRGTDYEVQDSNLTVVIHLRHCYEAWESRQRLLPDRQPPAYNSIAALIGKERWCLGSKAVRLGGKICRCHILSVNPDHGAPDGLLNFIS